MVHPLQHRQTAKRIRLSSTRARKHRSDGPEAEHALTIKLDHPMGARHKGLGETGKVRKAPLQGAHRDRDRNRQVEKMTVFRDTICKKA